MPLFRCLFPPILLTKRLSTNKRRIIGNRKNPLILNIIVGTSGTGKILCLFCDGEFAVQVQHSYRYFKKIFQIILFCRFAPNTTPKVIKSTNVIFFLFPSGSHTQKEAKTHKMKAACNSFFYSIFMARDGKNS